MNRTKDHTTFVHHKETTYLFVYLTCAWYLFGTEKYHVSGLVNLSYYKSKSGILNFILKYFDLSLTFGQRLDFGKTDLF